MLIDGKEVFSDEKQSMKIQQNINKNEYINQHAQSGLDPKEAMKELEGSLEGNHNMFFDDTLFGEEDDFANRSRRYQTYEEMDSMEFIHRGLELIADDASNMNSDNESYKIYSDDESIREIGRELFTNKLDLNNELWSIVYETCKKGDNFYEVIVDDYKNPKEIKRIRYLDPRKMDRVEIQGKLSHFVYRADSTNSRGTTIGSKNKNEEELKQYILFPWQVIHFKIEDKESAPYGGSILKSGVRTYRRLIMLEDIMLVYRISRAPERRVFYIDVGNLNAVEAKKFLSRMKDSYRSQSFIDENGNINKKANVLSITSDIFVPVKEGSQGTRIDTLQGGQAMGASGSEDPLLSYFRSKILRTMNIPMQYLGEESNRSQSLSQVDQKFGRFVERIQNSIVKGLIKLLALELFFKGYKKEDLENFKIELTPPSNVKEITEIDLFNQKMQLVSTIQQLNLFTNKWILRNILKFSEKEIVDLEMEKKLETKSQEGQEGEGGMMGGGPGMGMDMGMDMGMEGGMEGGSGMEGGAEIPPEAEPPEGGETELTASTIVNLFGKDFLLENKKDFFKLVNFIEESKNPSTTPKLFEEVLEGLEKQRNLKGKNNIKYQILVNEMKGINIKERTIRLYENNQEAVYYLEG